MSNYLSNYSGTEIDNVIGLFNGKGLGSLVGIIQRNSDGSFSVASSGTAVQSDWNQTDNTADDYIKNKPTIPVVDQNYDATSTNAQSGVAVASAISDSNNVFVVEPNVTTYNELLQAIEDKKELRIREADSYGYIKDYRISWISISSVQNEITIAGSQNNLIQYWGVKNDNTWNRGYSLLLLDNGYTIDCSSNINLESGKHYKINGQNLSAADVGAATPAYVDSAIAALPEPMIFKGSLGTGGTITTLPAASSSNEGFVYKVITAGTYASQAAKVGDTFISDGSSWVLIPSGDEPSGTVTSVGTGSGLTGGPITSSGTISLDTAYGDTVNPYGSKTANQVLAAPNGSNGTPSFRALVADDIPSITKSKISDFPSSMPASDVSAWAKANTKPTYTANEVGAQPTLVSGTNIKTINGTSLLGSGDLDVGGTSVYYKKDENTYITTTSSETTIPVGITGFRSTDILMVDVEGLNLVEDVDYTINGTNIVLTSPITHIGTTVHFTAMRIVEVTPQDYSALKGDDGDVSDVQVDGVSIVDSQGIADIDNKVNRTGDTMTGELLFEGGKHAFITNVKWTDDKETNNTTDTWVPVWADDILQHRVIPPQIGNRRSASIEYASSNVITNEGTSCELVQINLTEYIGFFTIRLKTSQARTNLACCRFKLDNKVLKPKGARSYGAKVNDATMLNSWWDGDWFVMPGTWNANKSGEIWGACIFTV